MKSAFLSLSLFGCVLYPGLAYGQADVSYAGGLLSIQCNEVPLAQVFEQIKGQTGLELILEDAVKSNPLTAHIEAQPFHLALERLLEGSGVNYAMFFDPQDWTRVTKIFIGSGGESLSTPAAPQANVTPRPVRRPPIRRVEPTEDEFVDEQEMLEEEFGDEPIPEELMEEEGFVEEGGFETPPDSAGSSYLPSPPSYPRSSATPGLESSPFGATNPQGQTRTSPQQQNQEDNPPPAYFPFLDPFGRPIPVPPGANPQQQQRKKNPQDF